MTKLLPGAAHLNTLWQAVSVAADLREMTRTRRTFVFHVPETITFFLRAENADVRIMRWDAPRVEVRTLLEGSFGWRVATDQDEAGVYVVAHRRRLFGDFSSALFDVVVPRETHLLLKLDNGRVSMEHVNGTLHVPPPHHERVEYLLPAGE
jgi:hypothetical protein